MRLWRVSRHRDLTGVGGLYVSGRWHTRGRRIVYAADHQATAQLEWLAHLEVAPEDFPRTIPFTEIDAADDVRWDEVGEERLPAGWQRDAQITRALGDDWLQRGDTALLSVPSVFVPARNVLANPSHRDAARLRIVRAFDFPLDPRLMWPSS